MVHTISVKKNYVEISASGSVNISGFKKIICDYINHPDTVPHMCILLDYRELETNASFSSYSKAESIADEMLRLAQHKIPLKMAIILTDSKTTITGNLVKSIREYHGLDFKTGHFTKREEALRWLLESSGSGA